MVLVNSNNPGYQFFEQDEKDILLLYTEICYILTLISNFDLKHNFFNKI